MVAKAVGQQLRPIINKNPRQSTMTVGWRSTNSSRGAAARTMMIMAATTASIMMNTWSTIPTEVMMESSEKTASRMMI